MYEKYRDNSKQGFIIWHCKGRKTATTKANDEGSKCVTRSQMHYFAK
jgi:hypothetical protein